MQQCVADMKRKKEDVSRGRSFIANNAIRRTQRNNRYEIYLGERDKEKGGEKEREEGGGGGGKKVAGKSRYFS